VHHTRKGSALNNLHPLIIEAINRALNEDIGSGDATSESIIPPEATMHGNIIAKQHGVIAGLDVAIAVCAHVDPAITCTRVIAEGSVVTPGTLVAKFAGPARSLLTAERTILNFMGRMSGVATLTHQFVQAVAGTRAIILDTRKTAPGLRMLDKLAVARGGGQNHRIGLYDMILIKDNHIDFAGSITEAVTRARSAHRGLEIEVEARTLDDVAEALALNVERILLDNMTLAMMRQAVVVNAGRAKLEASGNVTLETVRSIAETGVDYISSGALTHSAPVFDMSLKFARQ
jgi:nicotinate-nucleotide pyrophosphorylase (carboxylating)